ncbi:methyltransferase domain-containing protein [Sarocladium implicatum]|nr:methyltransferase domain-containing protein [Sarocladium implicatum]
MIPTFGGPANNDGGRWAPKLPSPAGDSAVALSIAIDPEHEKQDEADQQANVGYRSGAQDGRASSTMSLTDSVREFRKFHGRTFHNFKTESEYWGPNDDRQNDHLDLNHEMLLLAMDNRLYCAPISEHPERVLDIGTGTGIWAVDFADQFPDAEVIGTDISPTQSPWVPPNCKFELEDAELLWTYPDNHFDYIHTRLLIGSIKDWAKFYAQVYRCLKPGGWFEHCDYDPAVYSDDGTVVPGSCLEEWGRLFHQAGERMGQTWHVITDQRNMGWMRDSGFENVAENRIKLPLGPWAKKPELKVIGNFNLTATEAGLEGFALYILTKVLEWSLPQTQMFLAGVRKEMRTPSIHPYYIAASAFGQKPMTAHQRGASKSPWDQASL